MLIRDQLKDIYKNKDIADYFIEQGNKIANLSVRDIAKELFISPSTIVRFTQRLGFEGYNDFKEQYLFEIDYLNTHFDEIDINHPIDKKDRNVTIAHKISDIYHETIKDSLSLIEHDSLQQATHIIDKADKIYICSYGSHSPVSHIFEEKMLSIGKIVVSSNHVEKLFYAACHCDKKTAFIVISYTGETRWPLKIAQKLKERGIPIISITSIGFNSLYDISDVTLHISTRERINSQLGHFTVFLSIMYVLDVLYMDYFNLRYEKNYKNRMMSIEEFAKSFEAQITYNDSIKQE